MMKQQQQQPINASSTLSKLSSTKNTKKANTHSVQNNTVKSAPRRRALSEEITKPVQESSPSESTVKIELVTKSMRNHDDVNITKDSGVLNKVSRKRNRSAITEDEHLPLQSPVKKNAKRSRV